MQTSTSLLTYFDMLGRNVYELKKKLTSKSLSIALHYFVEVFGNMDSLSIWRNKEKIICQYFHLEDLEIW